MKEDYDDSKGVERQSYAKFMTDNPYNHLKFPVAAKGRIILNFSIANIIKVKFHCQLAVVLSQLFQ